MSRGLSYSVIGIGVVLVVVGAILHFSPGLNVFPHFTVVLGVVGVIVALAGLMGIVTARRA